MNARAVAAVDSCFSNSFDGLPVENSMDEEINFDTCVEPRGNVSVVKKSSGRVVRFDKNA